MRQLLPTPATVDPGLAHSALPRKPRPGRPWVMLNVVTSVDGATAVGGVSGPLGSSADLEVFSSLRAVADVVMAGATTVRVERYRPPRTSPEVQEARRQRGQRPKPRIAVVTASLDLDPELELFGDPAERPILLTTTDAPPSKAKVFEERAEVIRCGTGRVDLRRTVEILGDFGGVVLCEGGSSLNGQLLVSGLVDEVNLTLSPAVVAGSSPRLARDQTEAHQHLEMSHLWEQDGMLFARYLMAEPASQDEQL